MMPRADWVRPQEGAPLTPESLASLLQSVEEYDELTQRYARVLDYWQRNVLKPSATVRMIRTAGAKP